MTSELRLTLVNPAGVLNMNVPVPPPVHVAGSNTMSTLTPPVVLCSVPVAFAFWLTTTLPESSVVGAIVTVACATADHDITINTSENPSQRFAVIQLLGLSRFVHRTPTGCRTSAYRAGMSNDGNAPTVPDTQAPTHGPSTPGMPKPPDSRYALRALIGRGGMGEVWLAHDLRIDRDIAVKLMPGDATNNPDAVSRFLREARVQGRLEHPAVVPVHALGGADTAPFFASKRLIGTTLADVINQPDHDKWPRRTLLARFIDVCLAVEFAHQRGVIHRDLKPANIMLGDFGETYVLDWGLARIGDTVDSGVIRASDL